MVPSRIMVLERLPILSSGKIDRRALPAPDRTAMRSFVPPQVQRRGRMARLWSDILRQVPQVGVTDNFFELGGNSILTSRSWRGSAKDMERLARDQAA